MAPDKGTSAGEADGSPADETSSAAGGDASRDAGVDERVRRPASRRRTAPAVERVVLSAGVASDLAQQGWAGDPATGGIYRRDPDTGRVTFEPRGGESRAVEI